LQKSELREGRMRLRDLALTCKAFKDPALNCLWTFMDSLIPLVKILPNLHILDNTYVSFIHLSPPYFSNFSYPSKQYFHGTLPNDSAFRQYAPKIRILDLRPPPASQPNPPQEPIAISAQLLVYLMRELEGHLIFPGLKKVEIRHFASSGGLDVFSVLPLMCSSSVHSVALLGNAFSSPLFRNCCLPAMSHRLGSLKYLLIKFTNRNAASNLCDPILRLTTLENLQLEFSKAEGIPPNMILRLARTLTKLTTLVLDIHFSNHHVSDESFRLGETELGLSLNLNSVVVTSRLPDRVCPCIPQFLLARTTKFIWKLPNRTTITDPASFAPVIESLSKMTTLQFIKVHTNDGGSMNVATVLPFLLQLSLQGLTIELPILSAGPPLRPLIEAAFTGRLSDSRPATLKRLNLAHAVQVADGVRLNDGITLECISQVSQNAIGLEHLSAALRPSFTSSTPGGVSLQDWVTALRGVPRSTCTLQTMVICDGRDASIGTPFEEASSIAQILDLLFPRLVSIKPYQDDTSQVYWTQRWAYIENLRLSYKAARTAANRPGLAVEP
jgi:hypothetical protein